MNVSHQHNGAVADYDELEPANANGMDDAPTSSDESAGPRFRSPAERAKELGGQLVRASTGIETLDKATRGGLPFGRSIVIGGAPDAGKSMLAGQLVRHFALAGHHVASMVDDEPVDDLLIRWGQQSGLRREDLEEGNERSRTLLAKAFSDLPHEPIIVDGEEDGAQLEDVAAELYRRAGGPGVLEIDSLQTVRAFGTFEAKTKKDRVDAVVAAVRLIRKRYGHMVIATCELARGSYRSKNAAERIDDLASFKESGDIEYGFQVALVLRSVSGGGFADVTIAKNKVGKKLPFRLAIDFAKAMLTEVPIPDSEVNAEAASTDNAARRRILDALRAGKDLGDSQTSIYLAAKGTKAVTLRVAKEMIEAGELVLIAGSYRLAEGTK